MSNIKFSQLPNLGNITPTTTIPVVDAGQNYTITSANLQAYVNGGNGNITTGNLTATGNISASYFLGNGSQLTGLPATYTNSNVTTLLSSFGSNTITTTGNITAGYFIGDGSQLTNVGSYGNANVAAYLPTNTANVSAGNVIITGNLYLPQSANAVVYAAIQPVTGNVVQANAEAGSVLTYNIPGAGTWEIIATVNGSWNKNTSSSRQVAATLYDEANVQVGTTFNVLSVDGTLTMGVCGSSGTGTFIVTTTGAAKYNVKISGTGAAASSCFGTYKQLNANVAVSSVGYVGGLNYAGNVTATDSLIGNALSISGPAVITGNISGGNISTAGTVTVTGNISGGNISSTGLISTTGNLTGQLMNYKELVYNYPGALISGAYTPDWANGPVQTILFSNTQTVFTLNAPANMVTGSSITLILTQPATGSVSTLSANATYKFAGAYKTLSTTNSAIDVISIFYDGTNYLCNLVKGYAA